MNKSLESLPKPVLSLCMIVRNESQNLPRCLSSVKAYVDEMIVVDTGSEDGTPEIALQYGAKVYSFEWCDDFAAARNYAISKASGDWILTLDADEELVVESEYFLGELALHPQVLAYLLILTEVTDFEDDSSPLYVSKLFRNVGINFVGAFHEQLSYHNQIISGKQLGYLSTIRIVHYGRRKEHEEQKIVSRNIPMLERIRQREGLSLALVSVLAAFYDRSQQFEKSQECYSEAFDQLFPNLMDGSLPEDFRFVPSLVYKLGMRFLQQKDYELARLLSQRGLEWVPNYPPLNYLAGVILTEMGFFLGATTYFEYCLQMGREGTYYKYLTFGKHFLGKYPAYALGCAQLNMNLPQKALAAFELALSFDPDFAEAREKLEQVRGLD